METLTVGSLFSGIGGLDLGFERAGFVIKWQVEIDPYCRKVLHKHWPTVPCYEDVRTIGANDVERVDVIIGGFPCQPTSTAGRRRGQQDGRWLWPEYARLIGDLRPSYAVIENPTGVLSLGFSDVIRDLAALGYDAEWDVLPACFFGAPQSRRRVFCVAYPTSERHAQQGVIREVTSDNQAYRNWQTTDALDAIRRGAVPALCGSNNGVPHRVDRLRGLGNAVVPQVAQYVAECVRSHASGQVDSL